MTRARSRLGCRRVLFDRQCVRGHRARGRLARHWNAVRTPVVIYPIGYPLGRYRAFDTFGLEVADCSDDSYGQIGELRLEAFKSYLSLDPAAAGMSAEAYWQDLCELLVAEPYALTHQNKLLTFQGAAPEATDMIEMILVRLAQQWRAAYQDFYGDEAEALIAWLVLSTGRRDRYLPTAHLLGSDQWKPIVALAQAALDDKDRELAIQVFRAADRPGRHREFLRTRCRELTGSALEDSQPAR